MKIKATVNIFLANQGVQQQLNIKLRLINTKFQLRWLLNSLMQLIWSYLSLAKILKVYHRLLMFSFVLFVYFLQSFIIYSNYHCTTYEVSRRKKSPNSELFWSAFSPDFPAFGLNTERYRVSLRKFGENEDQNNSEYRLFLRSVFHQKFLTK